jgi:signal transduction histidine kinase
MSHPFRLGLRRPATLVVAAALCAALFGVGIAYANAATARNVAENARQLHAANAIAGSAGLTRAAVSQAVVFAAARDGLGASDEDVEAAALEAKAVLAALEGRLAGADDELAAPAQRFTDVSSRVIDLVEQGDAAGAVELRTGSLENAHAEFQALLIRRQDAAEASIALTETDAGRVALITRVTATLVLPITAMGAYWVWVRRRVQAREREMQTSIDAERAINHAKDELIAGISHELRTPLTSIHGFSEVLLTQGVDDAEAALEMIGIINAESGELGRMVEDLLTAARIDAGALSVVSEATDLAAALASVTEPWLRSGRQIAVDCPPLDVIADPLRLRQILRNLVSNAVRHGGSNLGILATRFGERVGITVADDGPGVAPEVADRLFDRYVNGGGQALLTGSVGLGLAVAQELAQRMGGAISYRRSNDVTLFVLELQAAGVGLRRMEQALAS